MKQTIIAIVASSILLLAACNPNDIITSLQLSVDAASVALPIIAQSAGITPALESQLENYLQSTNVAISQSSTILSGPGTPQIKSAQVVATFAAVIVPVLPAGTPLAVAQAIGAVSTDVARFLQTVATPKTLSVGHAPRAVKLDTSTLEKLIAVKSKAEGNLTLIRAHSVLRGKK